MRCIDELPAAELKGKRILLRTILNLPTATDGSITSAFRIKRALPTIEYLVRAEAKIIITGFFGRKGESMRPVADALMKLAPDIKFYFFGTSFDHASAEASSLKEGECLILENTRIDPREKANDPAFARLLAGLADIFVGDAFPDAHRTSASNVGAAEILPSYGGLLMCDEVRELDAARTPQSPSVAILGGAKFETKAPLIKSLLESYDRLLIVGALANDVFKAKGLPVGHSLVSKELPDNELLANPHFLAPIDVTVESEDGSARVKKPESVEEDEKIVDIGPGTVASVAPFIASAKSILWSGPTGMYENGYVTYTQQIAKLVAQSAENGAKVVIGGGDTIAAIEGAGVPKENPAFLSTGGGAMLEYLLKGILPGIAALDNGEKN